MNKLEVAAVALQNATTSASVTNFPAIFAGFAAKGYATEDVKPRENIFTYNAWLALGRQVRRGEHGVRIITWVPMSKRDPDTGETSKGFRRPRNSTVFHITQTDPVATFAPAVH